MDKVLTTTLLTMAAVVAAIMVMNTILPALSSGGSSVVSSSAAASERIKTDIEIIAASTNTATSATGTTTYVYFWVKNVGAANVLAVDLSDVFLKSVNTFERVAHRDPTPDPVTEGSSWKHDIEGSETLWTPGTTIRVTILLSPPLAVGTYTVTFSTNNGVSADRSFSVT